MDLLGRTTELVTPIGKLNYNWDANSNKTNQRINDQGTIGYSYDSLNRLASIKAMDGSVTSFEYDKVGNRSKITRSNGTDSHYSYNKANQLTSITHQKGSNTLAKFSYTLDENGRRTKVEETINGTQRIVSYSYDATGKLLEEKVQQGAQVTATIYNYDGVGNRLSKVENGVTTIYNYNANDQLLSETNPQDTITYDWNANGNLIKKVTPEGVITYSWNSSNKLIAIDDQINLRKVSYQYDGEDRRIGKVVEQNGNKTETQYLIDNERPYSEIVLEKTRVNQGNWTETIYLHTPDGVGDLLTQDQTGQVNYLYQDGQGSTRLTANNQGTAQATYHYDAFGNAQANATSNIKHRYVGEYLDNDSGFYHLRARDYDPKVGRFISRDSFEGMRSSPITLNPYLYGNSDPINSVDPTGEFSIPSVMVGIAINATIGAVISGGLTWYQGGNLEDIIISSGVGAITSVAVGGIVSGAVKLVSIKIASLQVASKAALALKDSFIHSDKLKYLLQLDPGKAKGFGMLGYTLKNSTALEKMLYSSRTFINESTIPIVTQHGTKYKVVMNIIGPNGKKGVVDVIWQQDKGTTVYKLITAIAHPVK